MLNLSLDETKGNEDSVVEAEGIKVVYESYLEGYVGDSVIDYSDAWYRRGFYIRGGNTSSC